MTEIAERSAPKQAKGHVKGAILKFRATEQDEVRWRADAARAGYASFSEWVRHCLDYGGGRREQRSPVRRAREPEAVVETAAPIEDREVGSGRETAVAIPVGRAVPSPQGFTALREQARDLAERDGKCTADVARGTRCKLCGKIH